MSSSIKKGDTVKVIAGAHKGKTGKVLVVSQAAGRVVVEGVRIIKKHAKRTQANPQGGVLQRESHIHISNVELAS